MAASHDGSIRRASLQHRSAAPISCFHWKRAKPLLTRDKTLGGFLLHVLRMSSAGEKKKEWEDTRTYFVNCCMSSSSFDSDQ